MRESRAYNNSTMFMVLVPYAVFGLGGFALYRAYHSSKRKIEPTELVDGVQVQ